MQPRQPRAQRRDAAAARQQQDRAEAGHGLLDGDAGDMCEDDHADEDRADAPNSSVSDEFAGAGRSLLQNLREEIEA